MSKLIKKLPSPTSNERGWPWTDLFTDSYVCDQSTAWPCISIITPSYNQGHFIEETIRSVLLQKYPNLEYIIIDGGSTDNTVEIIKKYETHLAYWISESDKGQTHAINKGLAKASGELIAYINSDDYYLPGTFYKIAEYYQNHPETDLIHGRCRYIDNTGNKIGEQFGNIQTFEEILDLWGVWWNKRQFVQPEVFWTHRITKKVGLFNESLNYVMDYDYWLRILRANGLVNKLDDEISCFRFTEEQKSNDSEQVSEELLEVVKPILWNKKENIAYLNRLKLKRKWIYHGLFLKAINTSVKSNETRIKRWIKIARLIILNPQILLSYQIYCRIKYIFDSRIKSIFN